MSETMKTYMAIKELSMVYVDKTSAESLEEQVKEQKAAQEALPHDTTREGVLLICGFERKKRCPYANAASAARSSVKSAIKSPLTCIVAAVHGVPDANWG